MDNSKAFDRWLLRAGGLVALLVVAVALIFQNTRGLNEDAGWVAHTHEVKDALKAVVGNLREAEAVQRTYLITGNDNDKAAFNAPIDAAKKSVERVKVLTADNPGQQAHIPTIENRIDELVALWTRTMGVRKEQGFDPAKKIVEAGLSRRVMADLHGRVREMDDAEEVLLRERSRKTEQTYRTALLTSLLSGVAAVVGVGAFLVRLRRHLAAHTVATRELAEQGERLRTTLASIGDAVITTDTEGRVTNLNPVAETLTGWAASEAVGQPLDIVFNIVNEETRKTVENPATRALREGVIVGLANHTVLISKAGTEYPIDDSAAPIRCNVGEVVGCVLVFRDITERKAAEAKERESEARFSQLAEGIPQLAWMARPDGHIYWYNQRWYEYTGTTPDQMQGWGWQSVHDPDELPKVLVRWKTAIATGEPFDMTFPLKAKDGVFRAFLTRVMPLLNGEGRVIQWFGTNTDISEQKRVEESLRQSNTLLRAISDGTTDLIYVKDRDSRMVFANPSTLAVIGKNEREVIGKNEVEWHTDPSEGEAMMANDRRIMAAAVAETVEEVFTGPRGTRTYLSTKSPMRDGEGAVVGIIGISHDITERRRAEAKLKEAERQFATTLEAISDGFMRFGPDWRIVYMNAEAERINQRPRAEIIGQSHWELFPATVGTKLEAEFRRAVAEQVTVELENYYEPWGRWFAVKGYPTQDGGLAIFFQDITERKHAQVAAEQRSEQVRRLADVANRITAALDTASVLRAVTGEARLLIGSHRSVVTIMKGEDWAGSLVVTDLSDKYARWRADDERPDGSGIYSLVCRTNKPMRLTQAELEAHPAYQQFGTHAPNHPPMRGWLAIPLVGRDGRNMGLLHLSDKVEGEFTADDEAVLVQLAQMVAVAVENTWLVADLKDADRRKDEFLSILAHELRNPLAPIRNGLQVMKLAWGNATVVEQARTMMERQLGQMVHLIDDLMDLTRISQGKVVLQKTRMPLAAAVRNAVETSRPLIEQAGHDLTLDMPPEPIFVDGDETRLSQVFANLLNNAAKYTDRGGRIRLAVERQGSDVVVAVEDNGVGIPANMLPRVFDMFTQVDRSLEKAQGGLGIGLSIVKRLVEMHGGGIEAESAGHGMGSKFVVRLPVMLSLATNRPDATAPDERSSPAARRRILVVDDNRDSAISLAMMLDIMGNKTQTAHDGLEAVEVAMAFKPDVILMDIGMPMMNGYDACRRIREQPWGRNVVLVACTGWGQDDDKRKSQDAGFNFHMVKPVDPTALEKLLSELQATTA